MTLFSIDPAAIEAPRQGSTMFDYELYQNYPNPFNEQTTISYSLAAPGHISIEICDLLGRRVSVLTSEEKSSGSHSVVWNAAELGSGVYFYTLKANSNTLTRPCIYLR